MPREAQSIMFPGMLGIAIGLLLFVAIFLLGWLAAANDEFTFEQKDGDFDKLLTAYLDIVKFTVSLAAGGIVLVISSTALASTRKLPPVFASPLFLLAMSVFYGILFMPLLVLDYEAFKHKTRPYTKLRYSRNQALGFSALACFCM